jgi:phosphopantothenoylcysteine decarboxylase/phosphopantothenate--cysteine ligase
MSQILFILSGSIACYKACDAISQLVQRGHRVRAIATKAALNFVGVATLEGLTREKVGTELFEEGAALEHITLARWADVTVVCPATAHTINRMAAGLGDDLAGALLLAHDWAKPLVISPAMNPAMWNHPATAAAVARLREWGARFIAVGSGRTACGEVGEGRLAESEDIVAGIEAAIVRPRHRIRVLVTSGGTAEPVDGVRVLTNTSTGETGALIAEHFARNRHDVLLLRARNARAAGAGCREDTFGSFAQLDAALAAHLGNEAFDVVIHAAAVGDFSIDTVEIAGVAHPPGNAKLRSDVAPVLRLKRNPKLLDTLRARSRNPAVRVVAFKLTRGASADETRSAVQALFASGEVDFVVHNDLTARPENGGAFPAEIWGADGTVLERCGDRRAIAIALERLVTAETSSIEEKEPERKEQK